MKRAVTRVTSIRMSDDLYKVLREKAAREDRTLNQQIVRCVRLGMDREEAKEETA